MRLVFCLLLATAAAMGQDPQAAMADSIARQRAAVERQRQAVRQQVHAPPGSTAGFFTVPWSEPLSETPPATAPVAECDPVPDDQIDPIVEETSKREGLTPDLLRAVIERESSYLPCAVSPAGAQGLMQLMPDTAAGLGVEDPFDTRQNVDGGARYLRQLLDRYNGNLPLALAAYNAGPTRADKVGILPLPTETSSYISGILQRLGSASAVTR
jgi:soluble lytic murein transglycosylase-like protein